MLLKILVEIFAYQNDFLHEEQTTHLAKHLTALIIYLQLLPGQNLSCG